MRISNKELEMHSKKRIKILFTISIFFAISLVGNIIIGNGKDGNINGTPDAVEKQKAKPIISIGENNQVSKEFSHVPHYGAVVAVNPINSQNIISSGLIFLAQYAHPSVAAYVSFDGGKSWKLCPIPFDVAKIEASNPIIIFGPDGTAYFSFLNKTIFSEENGSYPAILFRSEDGGNTWFKTLNADKKYLFDWHHLLVDQTNSKHFHHLYLIGTKISEKKDDVKCKELSLYYSKDKGNSFIGPVKKIENASYFSGATLSDGTLIVVYLKDKKLLVITSNDGGKSFSSPIVISEIHQEKKSAISYFPSLAVDTYSEFYKERIYVTWLDSRRGCYDVYLAWSSNKGKTWSSPIIINDNPPCINPAIGPDHTCPAVAVNKNGIVAVQWYDRRDDGASIKSMTWDPSIKKIVVEHDNRWQLYFAASLDGGETFLPNKKVSLALFSNDAPNNWIPMVEGESLSFYLPHNRYACAGKVGSFAASSDGIFHTFWVDSRTGISQIWTAPVQVKAKAFPNGSQENANLVDISPWIKLEVSNTKFILRDKTFEFDVMLCNSTKDQTFINPLKVRLLAAESMHGRWEVQEADNNIKGAGAIWDFSTLVHNGKLKPGEVSDKKHCTIKLKDDVGNGARSGSQFLCLKTKVLGKTTP
jgi:hypothetical protein